ncbi:Uncharacterised protein [Mycobacteroides abscessus subsp. abscessus]|nr:Uncharacterised protein [Mycobacteroides abscessus subsp. abscessus]
MLLKYFTEASGRRGSSANTSQLMNVFGWASRIPGLTRRKISAACSGASSTSTTTGKPRRMAMASAVTRRECTNETWMTMGSLRRTSAATAACGRYLASKVKLVCTASLGTPVVPEVCVMSAGS